MMAVWLEGGRLSLRRDAPVPAPPPGEALVRVLIAGICATDLELVRGCAPYAGIPGHEFVGVVEEGPPNLVGSRVVGEINAACGRCAECQEGRQTHCARRTVLGIVGRDGCFAEYLSLPAVNLHPVPSEVTTDTAVFTEPLAAALQVQQQVRIRPSDHVLVIGAGRLGQLVAQTLALTGCDLLVVGRRPEPLELLSARGIRTGPPDSVPPRSFHLAVECTGNPEGFAIARRALRPRGTLVMKSTYAGTLTVDASSLVVDEMTLLGSRCGPFPLALKHLKHGLVAVSPLVQGRYPLAEGLAAFEHAARPGALKILLDVGGM